VNLPILYLQLSIHFEWKFPFIFFRFKCGITNRGLKKRSKNIADTTPGKQFPVFFVIVPYPGFWETRMHQWFAHCHAPMKTGSGKTEWFKMGFLGFYFWEILMYYCFIWVWEAVFIYLIVRYLIQYLK